MHPSLAAWAHHRYYPTAAAAVGTTHANPEFNAAITQQQQQAYSLTNSSPQYLPPSSANTNETHYQQQQQQLTTTDPVLYPTIQHDYSGQSQLPPHPSQSNIRAQQHHVQAGVQQNSFDTTTNFLSENSMLNFYQQLATSSANHPALSTAQLPFDANNNNNYYSSNNNNSILSAWSSSTTAAPASDAAVSQASPYYQHHHNHLWAYYNSIAQNAAAAAAAAAASNSVCSDTVKQQQHYVQAGLTSNSNNNNDTSAVWNQAAANSEATQAAISAARASSYIHQQQMPAITPAVIDPNYTLHPTYEQKHVQTASYGTPKNITQPPQTGQKHKRSLSPTISDSGKRLRASASLRTADQYGCCTTAVDYNKASAPPLIQSERVTTAPPKQQTISSSFSATTPLISLQPRQLSVSAAATTTTSSTCANGSLNSAVTSKQQQNTDTQLRPEKCSTSSVPAAPVVSEDIKLKIRSHKLFPVVSMFLKRCDLALSTGDRWSEQQILEWPELKQFLSRCDAINDDDDDRSTTGTKTGNKKKQKQPVNDDPVGTKSLTNTPAPISAVDVNTDDHQQATITKLLTETASVMRLHLFELEKVDELCQDFCDRYQKCLRAKYKPEQLVEELGASDYMYSNGIIGNSHNPYAYFAGGSSSGHCPQQHHPSAAQQQMTSIEQCMALGGNSMPPYYGHSTSAMSYEQAVQAASYQQQQQQQQYPLSIINRQQHWPSSLDPAGAFAAAAAAAAAAASVMGGYTSAGSSSSLSYVPNCHASMLFDQRGLNLSGICGGLGAGGVRGALPKQAVSMMRAWLFANVHHPYPSEDEKREFAEKCNLSLMQINNWFINARRRILQPMVGGSNSGCNTNNASSGSSSNSIASPPPTR